MKYLKTYESHGEEPIKEEISDLLVDLTDIGFKYDITPQLFQGETLHIYLRIYKDEAALSSRLDIVTFTWSDIEQVIDRMIAYLSDRYTLLYCDLHAKYSMHNNVTISSIKKSTSRFDYQIRNISFNFAKISQ